MILVTGGSGLLGTILIEQLLQKGHAVRAIYNKTPLNIKPHSLFQQFHVDILDVVALENCMEDIQQVYHCAGLVSFAPGDVQKLYKINVEGTANVVNAALHAGVKKLIHVSSVAALGRLREGQMLHEKMVWSDETNSSVYGHSKYLGELEVWRSIAEGLEAVIVNPVIILGPGNWNQGSTKIFQSAYNEFPWFTEGVTGFVDVRDVVEAMIQLMDSTISGERYIISAENATYKSVFEMIAKKFGKKPPYKIVSPTMANLFWRWQKIKSFFTGTVPLVTKETTASAMAKVYFDNQKLLSALPNFKYKSLQDTIDYTCEVLQQKINIS